jgi:hypothetical protein
VGSVEEQRRQQGYFVRLGSLSARIRHLAYEHSLGKLRQSKHRAQDILAQLQKTLELVRTPHPCPLCRPLSACTVLVAGGRSPQCGFRTGSRGAQM